MILQSGWGLKWRIGGTYTVVMLVVGSLAIGAVYYLARNTVRDQLDKRALAITTNFSDAAAGHLASKNLLALNTLARKYTVLEGTAYAYVKNSAGETVAHTFGTIPDSVRQENTPVARSEVRRRELTWADRPVYEMAMPMLEGRLGFAHVGFWSDAAAAEIRSAILPIVAIIAFLIVLGAVLSFFLAQWIVQPIVGLTAIADKLTRGNLEASVGRNWLVSPDEIGDLARSLERMRSSLKAAIVRLSRDVA